MIKIIGLILLSSATSFFVWSVGRHQEPVIAAEYTVEERVDDAIWRDKAAWDVVKVIQANNHIFDIEVPEGWSPPDGRNTLLTPPNPRKENPCSGQHRDKNNGGLVPR